MISIRGILKTYIPLTPYQKSEWVYFEKLMNERRVISVKKNNKVVSLLMAASMLFGMSLPAVQAEETVICPVQDFESATTATDAGWTWKNEEPTIETSIGNNTGNSLTFNGNGAAAPEMIYNFTTTERFTVKMKLYMESDADTYIRFINSNNKYIDIMSCGWSQIIWQENRTNIGTYTTGWNDVAITFDPAQQSYSFTINDISVAETAITNSEFFNYDIASFKVIKTGKAATVAIDDFSITAATASNAGLDWNGEEATLPTNTNFYNGLTATYVTDAFGDTTKGSSLAIGTVADNSPMLQLNPIFGNLTGNTAFSYSFDLGINNFSESRTTEPSYFFQFFENSAVIGDDYGFNIDATGKINFFGTETDYSINAGEWHTIKYVMASNGANTKQNASLYIDGNYVTSATLNIKTTAETSKIDRLRFCNNSTSSTMYVDNVKLESLETPMITSTDSTIAALINTSDYQICGYGMPDMTAGEFVSKTTGAVVKKDGAEAAADALLNDCDIYSTTANGELIKWENIIQVVNKDIVEKQTFDSLSANDIAPDNGAWPWCNLNSNAFLAAYAKSTTISISGAIAGKTEDDKCVVIKGENIDQTLGLDPFVSLIAGAGAKATTLDVQLYMEGAGSTYIQALNSSNQNVLTPIVFNADGSVLFFGTLLENFNWISETADSKWMDVSIAVDTMLNKTTVIINNKIIGQYEAAADVYGYKFISMYSEDGQDGLLAIDNIHFCEGLPETQAFGNIDVQYENDEYVAILDVISCEKLPIMFVTAKYDENNQLINVGVENYNVEGMRTIKKNISLDGTEADVKVFAWNPNNLQSYVNCWALSTQIQ